MYRNSIFHKHTHTYTNTRARARMFVLDGFFRIQLLTNKPAMSQHTNSISTHKLILTPKTRVLREKLKVPQPVNKFPAFYATQRFITAFTAARHLSLRHSPASQPISLRSVLIILYYDQQMHNNFTNYHTPTCYDTFVSSSGSL